jgi:hypothetical protein
MNDRSRPARCPIECGIVRVVARPEFQSSYENNSMGVKRLVGVAL